MEPSHPSPHIWGSPMPEPWGWDTGGQLFSFMLFSVVPVPFTERGLGVRGSQTARAGALALAGYGPVL